MPSHPKSLRARYVIDAGPRTGYRLVAEPDRLRADQVLSQLESGLYPVELDGEHDRIRHCIVGIGLNVRQRPRDFAPSVRVAATSVSELVGGPVQRGPLLARLLDEFAKGYKVLLRDGGQRVQQEVRRHSAVIGRSVLVHEGASEPWPGIAVDVQKDGALLVRPAKDGTDRGGPSSGRRGGDTDLVKVYAADVSIRTMEEKQ